MRESGYFDTASITKPLLHTWSLAVEEQFYILFPLLLITINRFSKNKYLLWIIGAGLTTCLFGFGLNTLIKDINGYNNIIPLKVVNIFLWLLYISIFPVLYNIFNRFTKNQYLICLLCIGIVSFITSIYGTYLNQTATFYLVPTRAWELLFGSILALGVIPQLQSNFHRHFFSIVGLGLIVLSVRFYTEEIVFPGAAALAPVMGASLIIYSGIGGGSSVISKFLSLKPIVYIGLISYSLYLWHWPLFVFAKYMISRDLTSLEIIGIILATFLISAFSLRFIEQPFRGNQPIIPERKKLFALSAIVMVIASIIGRMIYFESGMPGRCQEAIERIAGAAHWDWYDNCEYGQIEVNMDGGIIPQIGAKNIKPSFVLWGDSHAMSYIPAMQDLSIKYGLSGFVTTLSSTPPIIGIDRSKKLQEYYFNKKVMEFIKSHPEIKTVFIAALWSVYTKSITLTLDDIDHNYMNCNSDLQLVSSGLEKTIDTLQKMNRKVILIEDFPSLTFEPVKAIWLSVKYKEFYKLPEDSYNDYYKDNKNINKVLFELAQKKNLTLLSPEYRMFDKAGHVIVVANNKLLYRNSGHISTEGSRFVSPVFDDVFKKMAKATLTGSSLISKTFP